MFLSASPQDAFRSAEISVENTDASAGQGSRESFRTSEIVAQNTAASAGGVSKMTLLMAGVGLFLVYKLLLKGKT